MGDVELLGTYRKVFKGKTAVCDGYQYQNVKRACVNVFTVFWRVLEGF